jgi:hypothetical protein
MDDVLKTIQGLAAAIVSVTIAASVSYETGYFSIIGYKYQGLLSAADYASSALEWLPWLFLVYGLGFLLARAESSKLIGACVRFRMSRPQVFWTVGFLLFSAAAAIVVLLPFYQVLIYAPVVVLPFVAVPLFLQSARLSLLAQWLTTIVISGVVVLLALFCSGIGHAHRDLAIIDNAYVIRLNEGREGVQILRTLGKGLLVLDPADNKVDFVRWEKVDRLTHPIWKSADAPWMDALGCKFVEALCYHKPAPAP